MRATAEPMRSCTWRRESQGCRSQLNAGNQESSTRRKSSSRYSCALAHPLEHLVYMQHPTYMCVVSVGCTGA